MRDAGAKMGKGRWGRSTRTRTLRSGHVVRGHFSMSSRLGSKLCKQAWARALSGAACGVGWGGGGRGLCSWDPDFSRGYCQGSGQGPASTHLPRDLQLLLSPPLSRTHSSRPAPPGSLLV